MTSNTRDQCRLAALWQSCARARPIPSATLPRLRHRRCRHSRQGQFVGQRHVRKDRARALALLPFVTLPTDEDNGISPEHVEGGLIVPLALKPCRTSSASASTAAWFGSRTTMRPDTTPSIWPPRRSPTSGPTSSAPTTRSRRTSTRTTRAATSSCSAPASPTRSTNNLQLDAGVNFGVTSAADRVNPFVGVSTRF